MGSAALTPAETRERLREAWNRYNDHQEAGDDMVKAGEELAQAVSLVVKPAPCGIPRSELLVAKRKSRAKRPNPFLEQGVTPHESDDLGFR